MGRKKLFSGTKLKGAIAIGLGLLISACLIIVFSTTARAADYNSNSGWAIDAGNGNTDMRAYSCLGYNASFNDSYWIYHNTKDGDNYKPHMGDIVVYGCYPYGVDYYGGVELGTAHVEICVEDYNEETGNYGVIGGNTGNSFTDPYYLGSSVAFTYVSWNRYYQAAYGDRFIYNIWEVTDVDIADNIVYSANQELCNYNESPENYRQMIFSLQGARNWCDIFVSKTLQYAVEVPVKYGYLSLTKVSDRQEEIIGNPLYSLKDAVYMVYLDYECTEETATLMTDENGCTDVITLEEGIYYVKEQIASYGHALDNNIYTAEIYGDETTYITSTEPTKFYSGDIIIKKICADDYDKKLPLSGAEFLISYYADENLDSTKEPDKTWTVTTSWNADSDSYSAALNEELLYGVYTIEEIKAPHGYSIKDNVIYSQTGNPAETTDGKYTLVIDETFENSFASGITVISEDHPYQIHTTAGVGDSMNKIAEDKGTAVLTDKVDIVNPDAGTEENGNVIYKLVGNLYDKETGEIITDQNGDEYEVEEYVMLGGKENAHFTINFTVDNIEKYDDSKIVIGEKLYMIFCENGIKEEILVADETDMEEISQTINVKIKPEETTTEKLTKEETTTEEPTTEEITTEELTTEEITTKETTTEELTIIEETTAKSNSPKTGDSNDGNKYMAIIFIALGIIGSTALIIRRKKVKNK